MPHVKLDGQSQMSVTTCGKSKEVALKGLRNADEPYFPDEPYFVLNLAYLRGLVRLTPNPCIRLMERYHRSPEFGVSLAHEAAAGRAAYSQARLPALAHVLLAN